jgi:DNA adenine methylase
MKPLHIPGLNTYFGGKGGAGVAQQIINRVPPHDTLIVPFLGNCALTRTIRRPARVIANDLDPAIIDKWQAAQVPGIELRQGAWQEFIGDWLLDPQYGRLVIYCDPPYLFDSRRGGDRKQYAHEMGDEASHQHLLARLRSFGDTVPILLSHYTHTLYDDLLHDWHRVTFTAQTRRGPATEALYFNFAPPPVLHDDRFAGDNYRQREYLKRKASRWLAKWETLPPYEQQVLLSRILKQTPLPLVREILATLPGNTTAADPATSDAA